MDDLCRLRPATSADLAAVAAMERAVFPDPWSARALEGHLDDIFVLATTDHELRGYVIARTAADEAELLNLAVHPGYRRRGLGRRLLEAAASALMAAGARRIYLEVRASNASAIAFYGSAGFRHAGRRLGYYRHPREDALLLVRPTAPETGAA